MSREIPLTKGLVALVDDEDFELVSALSWRAIKNGPGSKTWYAASRQKKPVMMHALIMGRRDGFEVDHRSRDGLDNRRGNLRWATRAQNMANRSYPPGVSGYRGVYPRRDRWRAKIMVGREQILIGDFDTSVAAAAAYDAAAKQHHGEFATLNFSNDRDWILPFNRRVGED